MAKNIWTNVQAPDLSNELASINSSNNNILQGLQQLVGIGQAYEQTQLDNYNRDILNRLSKASTQDEYNTISQEIDLQKANDAVLSADTAKRKYYQDLNIKNAETVLNNQALTAMAGQTDPAVIQKALQTFSANPKINSTVIKAGADKLDELQNDTETQQNYNLQIELANAQLSNDPDAINKVLQKFEGKLNKGTVKAITDTQKNIAENQRINNLSKLTQGIDQFTNPNSVFNPVSGVANVQQKLPNIGRVFEQENAGKGNKAFNASTQAIGASQIIPARAETLMNLNPEIAKSFKGLVNKTKNKNGEDVYSYDPIFIRDLKLGEKEATDKMNQLNNAHWNNVYDTVIADPEINKYFGQKINGVTITPESASYVAHFGGFGNLKRGTGLKQFLATGGKYNPQDENKKSLMDYFNFGANTDGGLKNTVNNILQKQTQALNGINQYSQDIPVGADAKTIQAQAQSLASSTQANTIKSIGNEAIAKIDSKPQLLTFLDSNFPNMSADQKGKITKYYDDNFEQVKNRLKDLDQVGYTNLPQKEQTGFINTKNDIANFKDSSTNVRQYSMFKNLNDPKLKTSTEDSNQVAQFVSNDLSKKLGENYDSDTILSAINNIQDRIQEDPKLKNRDITPAMIGRAIANGYYSPSFLESLFSSNPGVSEQQVFNDIKEFTSANSFKKYNAYDTVTKTNIDNLEKLDSQLTDTYNKMANKQSKGLDYPEELAKVNRIRKRINDIIKNFPLNKNEPKEKPQQTITAQPVTSVSPAPNRNLLGTRVTGTKKETVNVGSRSNPRYIEVDVPVTTAVLDKNVLKKRTNELKALLEGEKKPMSDDELYRRLLGEK